MREACSSWPDYGSQFVVAGVSASDSKITGLIELA